MRVWKALLIVVALCAALAAPIPADTRTSNIDVVIALDKSLSMETKIGAVEAWVNSSIIDQLLIPGDFLVVVAFYGKAEVIISQQVKDDADKQTLKQKISQVKGNGSFTDIGNALDVVKAQVAERESDGREKYVLLLTDGIQEAPATSKYYSKNGQFNHEFLANTKTIQEKGGPPEQGGIWRRRFRDQSDCALRQIGCLRGPVRRDFAVFKTRKAPINPRKPFELFAFMEAADASLRRGRRPRSVKEFLAKARAAASSKN